MIEKRGIVSGGEDGIEERKKHTNGTQLDSRE
jgi:hypothetical protein